MADQPTAAKHTDQDAGHQPQVFHEAFAIDQCETGIERDLDEVDEQKKPRADADELHLWNVSCREVELDHRASGVGEHRGETTGDANASAEPF